MYTILEITNTIEKILAIALVGVPILALILYALWVYIHGIIQLFKNRRK